MLQRKYNLSQHGDRERLVNEAHSRPAQSVPKAAQISLLVMLSSESTDAASVDRAHVVDLARRVGAPEPAPDSRHHVIDTGVAIVVWERHTEFSTYTFYRAPPGEAPGDETALAAVSDEWVSGVSGEVLAAMHLSVIPSVEGGLDENAARAAFGRDDYAASRVRGATASVAADFRLHGDGFSRMLLFDSTPNDQMRGRLIQKLIEIETYRLAALLALPAARDAQPVMARLEAEVDAMSERIAAPPHMTKDRDLLQRLSRLAGETEALTARSAFRFAASAAYHRIVQERITRLREERIPGHERFEVFMERRLAPAMRTCESMAARQARLAARIDRAVRLLAARVDVQVEEQNARLLLSMNRRAQTQLRLQETVEGLSTVAITYYGVGLIAYVAKGIAAAGASWLNPTVAAALAAPAMFAGVWYGLRRVRASLHREPEPPVLIVDEREDPPST